MLNRRIFGALCLFFWLTIAVSADEAQIDALMQPMTLEQKIGQLFMVSVYNTVLSQGDKEFLQEFQPGAVALFPRNTSQLPEGIAALINAMQQAISDTGGLPLIIATDQEGWEIQRLWNGFTRLPDPLIYGAVNDPQTIVDLARATGAELGAVGVNMNLAPVADLTTRDDFLISYRVMNHRTWGDNPQRVGELTAAYIGGLKEAGVIGVLKHFPGHGGAVDSHEVLPRLDFDTTEARRHILAFQVALEQGAPAVMVGHLYYSALEPETDLPASLSPTMMSILRDDIGFAGVILSDALDMGALKTRYYQTDAMLAFFRAGGDMIVVGPFMERQYQREAKQRLIAAVASGEIPESRIDASVRRILRLKMDYGLIPWQPIEPSAVTDTIASAGTSAALEHVYQNGLTLVRDETGLLPLSPDANLVIFYPLLQRGDMAEVCKQLAPQAEYIGFTLNPPQWTYGKAAILGRDSDAVVIFTDNALKYPGQQRLVNAAPPEKTIVIALSNPYDLEAMPGVSTSLTTYSSNAISHAAACRALFGEQPIVGRLPVAIADFASGTGLSIMPNRQGQ